MPVKKRNVLLSLTILSISLCSCSASGSDGFSFHYPQGRSNDYQGTAYYTDDYFKEDASTYNPSLSTSSLCFAMASFASNNGDVDYLHRYGNSEEFLKNCGFSEIEANAYYKEKPTSDSLGVVMGHKKIDEYTLIAVGVRGGNYEMEWASNFTLGDGEDIKQHLGFYQASSVYLDSLELYLKEKDIEGALKIWTVGYSRGGASNNLASGRIDQRINEGKPLFDGLNVTIEKKDLYSYCFEAPQGASFKESISPKSEIYSNIHNVINHNDLVPKVAMSDFRFTRYGVDYYLPDPIRNSDYSEYKPKMQGFYNDLDDRNELGEYLISSFDMFKGNNEKLNVLENSYTRMNWTSGLFLDEFVSELTNLGVGTLANYVENIQSGLRNVFQIFYSGGGAKFSFMNLALAMAKSLLNYDGIDILLNNLIYNQSAFVSDLLHVLKTAFTSMGYDIDVNALLNGLKTLIGAIAKTLLHHIDYFFAMLSSDNVKAIVSAHYPEVCLSHLMALDPNYNKAAKEYHNDGSYYRLSVPSVTEKTTIAIKDEKGKTVAGLSSGSLYERGSLSYGSKSQTFVCYIPVDKEYAVEIENAGFYQLDYLDAKKEEPVSYKAASLAEGEAINFITVTYPEKSAS